ncbi:type II secretion system F family protein [uncultured Spongiibacter sp.]|uniref:type II secretion system F family protein n=1 Tax=Spongiibacter marinus TaxID=354246 RepID=UPI00258590C1|nr:type II secretion system F family protein [uncultured Spongiibacter sp.]
MEAQHYFFIIGALILCTAPVILLATAHINSDASENTKLEFGRHDTWRMLREENTHIASLSQLLRRAGLFTSAQQIKAISFTLVACLVLGVIAAAASLFKGLAIGQVLAITGATVIGSIVLAYLILKNQADERQNALEKETMMLIQTTRMLWRVGLSLPKTLGIICEQLSELSPNCAKELSLAANKIESGQSQEEALYELINSCSAEGFKEYLIVIRQQSITGGSIDKSLDELYLLLQNRRRLSLQEQVNKISGKMSLVMMLFLFPALVLLAAGPSFFSMVQALNELGG